MKASPKPSPVVVWKPRQRGITATERRLFKELEDAVRRVLEVERDVGVSGRVEYVLSVANWLRVALQEDVGKTTVRSIRRRLEALLVSEASGGEVGVLYGEGAGTVTVGTNFGVVLGKRGLEVYFTGREYQWKCWCLWEQFKRRGLRVCPRCKALFEGRRNKSFCSETCRKMAWKRGKHGAEKASRE